MFRRVALAVCLSLPGAAFAAAAPVDEAELKAVLAKADELRAEWGSARIKIRVTNAAPNSAPKSGELEVATKDGKKSRISFLDPKDAGKLFVTSGDDAWLLIPGTKNPIKVPKSHRLSGGFAAADVSRTRFADDYDPVYERPETLDGHECWVVRLLARKGHAPTYPIVRVWVDPKERVYRKAIFLLSSGRTAKETTFDAYKKYRGILAVEKMTIVDALKPGTTTVEYLDYEKATFPDAIFDPKTAREAR